jgi:hypothetical protein
MLAMLMLAGPYGRLTDAKEFSRFPFVRNRWFTLWRFRPIAIREQDRRHVACARGSNVRRARNMVISPLISTF